MKQRSSEKHSRYSMRSIAAATAISVGALAYGAHEINSVKQEQKESAESADKIKTQLETLNEKVKEQERQLAYMQGLNGLDKQVVERHLSYPPISLSERQVSPNIVEKHKEATLYILSAPAETSDPSTPLTFACSAVKIDDTTLSSARHCFPTISDYPPEVSGKGGGDIPANDLPYQSPLRYFAASRPTMTMLEAQEQAVEIIGYGTDYISGDSALLAVQPNDWFNSIEPLPLYSMGMPQKGEAVHVAGYPNGSVEAVAAQGTVLGTMRSDEAYDSGYISNLLIVGVTPKSTEDFTCSFGASGSSIATADGHSFGALAFVSRSFTPESSLDVTLNGEKTLQFEEQLQTRLAGEDYILCAYSPILPVQIKPLQVQTDPLIGYEGK